MRQQFSKRLSNLRRAATAALREQKALSARLMRGRVDPATANAANRELTLRLEALRNETSGLERLLAVAKSSEVGGFLDVPFDEYRVETRSQTPSSFRLTRRALLLWWGCFLAGVGGTLGFLWVTDDVNRVRLEVRRESAEVVEITVHNDGVEPVKVCVPWPDGLDAVAENDRRAVYGLAVYGRYAGSSETRLLDFSQESWRYLGVLLKEARVVEVGPEQSCTFGYQCGMGIDVIDVSLRIRDGGVADAASVSLTE